MVITRPPPRVRDTLRVQMASPVTWPVPQDRSSTQLREFATQQIEQLAHQFVQEVKFDSRTNNYNNAKTLRAIQPY